MSKRLSRKEAIKFLGLDEKTFNNYFKNAGEFACLPRKKRERYFFDAGVLKEWLNNYKWRNIELNFDDYKLCLDFALAQHFRGYVLSDWGTARQREFGQKITNWVKGQLAEIAVKKFLEAEFNLSVELDFDIHPEIVPQDIIAVAENDQKRAPKLDIGIKSSKPKSAYLVLSENEVTIPGRKSDIYIFCRPDIPDDHLLRLTRERIIAVIKNEPHFPSYKEGIPDFKNMYCEVSGWCKIEELAQVSEIPGQKFSGTRFVKKTGLLHRSKPEWQQLIDLI